MRSAGGGQGPGRLSSHRGPRAARARVRVRGAHPLRAPTGQWPWEARGDSAVWHLRARDRFVPVRAQGAAVTHVVLAGDEALLEAQKGDVAYEGVPHGWAAGPPLLRGHSLAGP